MDIGHPKVLFESEIEQSKPVPKIAYHIPDEIENYFALLRMLRKDYKDNWED